MLPPGVLYTLPAIFSVGITCKLANATFPHLAGLVVPILLTQKLWREWTHSRSFHRCMFEPTVGQAYAPPSSEVAAAFPSLVAEGAA